MITRIDKDVDVVITTEYTHKCQTCGNKQKVDDFHKHAPHWCNRCVSVETFERLK